MKDELRQAAEEWVKKNGYVNWHYSDELRTKVDDDPNEDMVEAFLAGARFGLNKAAEIAEKREKDEAEWRAIYENENERLAYDAEAGRIAAKRIKSKIRELAKEQEG